VVGRKGHDGAKGDKSFCRNSNPDFPFCGLSLRAKDVYKWVDEKGTVHFSEDESSVPEKYRDQLEKKSLPEESQTPKEKVKTRKQDGKGAKEKLAGKEKERANVNKIEGDVIESVKTIISLWKDEKYQALYDHGDQKSRMAVNRETFEHRMTKKGIGLASSWETIRDIKVEVKSATLAYATVKIGFKPTRRGDTQFRTETYRMSLEKGMWKIDLSKILSAKI
jgi:endogenous inhibitor of DNA gyrase (YacG/DUF329 family)